MTPCTVKLYALSTCVHCRHAKQFLDENSVPYDCVYVDQLQGDDRKQMLEEVKKYNPRTSFPTLVITSDCETVIVGFQPEDLTKALHL